MVELLYYVYLFWGLTGLLYMWISVIRDLAQIRAAQKIECESIARLAKLLDEDREDEI